MLESQIEERQELKFEMSAREEAEGPGEGDSDERTRIAQELHDTHARVTSVGLKLDTPDTVCLRHWTHEAAFEKNS